MYKVQGGLPDDSFLPLATRCLQLGRATTPTQPCFFFLSFFSSQTLSMEYSPAGRSRLALSPRTQPQELTELHSKEAAQDPGFCERKSLNQGLPGTAPPPRSQSRPPPSLPHPPNLPLLNLLGLPLQWLHPHCSTSAGPSPAFRCVKLITSQGPGAPAPLSRSSYWLQKCL